MAFGRCSLIIALVMALVITSYAEARVVDKTNDYDNEYPVTAIPDDDTPAYSERFDVGNLDAGNRDYYQDDARRGNRASEFNIWKLKGIAADEKYFSLSSCRW